jgi:hypothetical protein
MEIASLECAPETAEDIQSAADKKLRPVGL